MPVGPPLAARLSSAVARVPALWSDVAAAAAAVAAAAKLLLPAPPLELVRFILRYRLPPVVPVLKAGCTDGTLEGDKMPP
eukprot:CAMPEP_0202917940 /NCGR_PEP_ID=MMETSP1392-20130828/72211_1 /ASSEMBLY_ACC=CAM_ASM_000868 /TAXON_ID=225041 /ORGANISM="Chlamydomonas chlamydogama, Strain SAG 11-48b" /LENGTH=79 /DNA_ID=CAMNT_0049610843 /DNA_START=140 /DNA_END=375 /DNA_ORIENTATION=-